MKTKRRTPTSKPVPMIRMPFLALAGATLIVTFFTVLLTYATAPSHDVSVVRADESPTPILARMNLSSNVLTNSDIDLYKLQVGSTQSGTGIAFKQILFRFTKSPKISLTNFRLRRGAYDVSGTDYAVTCVNVCSRTGTHTDLKVSAIPSDVTSGIIAVSFTNAEQIVSSGNIYALHALVSGATAGQSMTLVPAAGMSSTVTGSLANSVTHLGFAPSPNIFHLDTDGVADGLAERTGFFLWSPAITSSSGKTGTRGGSNSWRNDAFMDPGNIIQVLSL
jgi:hypothetical protein